MGPRLVEVQVLDLKTELSELSKIQQGLDTFVESGQLSVPVSMSVMLALEELFTNVVMYGHGDSGTHDVRITLRVVENTMECEIVDDGKPFDPTVEAPIVNTDSSLEERVIGGLGIHCAFSLMDAASYSREDGKNRLVLRKNLG